MNEAMKELQAKFKQMNTGGTNEKVQNKKQQLQGNKDNFSSAKNELQAKLLLVKKLKEPKIEQNSNKNELSLPPPPPLPLSLPPPPPLPSLTFGDKLLPPPPPLTANNTILPPPPSIMPSANSNQTSTESKYNDKTPKKKIFDSKQSPSQSKTKSENKHNIFDFKPKTHQKSTSHQLFGVDVAGYFKSILMTSTDIPKVSQLSVRGKTQIFHFPSIQTQLRQNKEQTIFFSSDADLVSYYMPYYQCQMNKQIIQKNRKSLKSFLSKYQSGTNWNTQDPKAKQLSHLKNTLSFIQTQTYLQLDYGKLKKTSHKISNIIKKFQREQNYIKCQQYKKLKQKIQTLYKTFWGESRQNKNNIKKQLDEITQAVSKI